MSHQALATAQTNRSESTAQPAGRMRGEVSLTVHSRYAKSLIRGRPASSGKPAIIGLLGFAHRLRVIWQAARRDDPYADWWLIRLDVALEQAQEKFRDEQIALEMQWESWSTLQIAVAESQQPSTVSLRFSNPYAYRAAELVGEFDLAARMLLTSRHVGLVCDQSTQEILNDCSAALRRLFTMSLGYRRLGIDRSSLRSDVCVRERARSSMGQLPVDILVGERRPELAMPPKATRTVSHNESQDACDP